jgi:hypothetical protein
LLRRTEQTANNDGKKLVKPRIMIPSSISFLVSLPLKPWHSPHYYRRMKNTFYALVNMRMKQHRKTKGERIAGAT